MLSKYFYMKTSTKKFDDDLLWSMGEIKGKKVLLYGAGEGFVELNKKYFFTEVLNIVAIADKKFECTCGGGEHCHCGDDCKGEKEFLGMRAIAPSQIPNEDFDVILITNESTKAILKYVLYDLKIQNKDVRTIFNEEVPDEQSNYNYLEKYNFTKSLKNLTSKTKGEPVVIYGTGTFFETINRYYDLSDLNIVGVSDKKFANHEPEETFLGYKVYSLDEVVGLNPKYVIVATKFYTYIVEDLYYNVLAGTKIKIKPLLMKPFFTLLKEIWR